MTRRFAAVVVRLRVVVVLLWVAAAVVLTLTLPSLEEAQTGGLGDLVPVGAEAVETERRAAELFAFPLTSRTYVVQRRAGGLPAERQARAAELLVAINRDQIGPVGGIAGAYGLTNALPVPFARERGTTAFGALLIAPEAGPGARTDRARRYAAALGPPAPGEFVGVTGTIPARVAQADAIRERLPLITLVTVLLVVVAVAVYLRSAVAPLAALLTVAVAYLVAIRLVAAAGDALGISVPSEIEPVIVALLFGVVTDYALFYMSRFRRLLAEGLGPSEAARRTIIELTPIVLACGLAVVFGTAALVVAELGFLRAFGPGLALTILVGLLVALTLLPALLALLGARLLWPARPARSPTLPTGPAAGGGSERLLRRVVGAPRRTVALCLLVLAPAIAGLAWLEVGNPLIRGLPADSEVRQAYAELGRGFAPGAAAPTSIVVEGPGITRRRAELAALQAELEALPGVAGVIGPATPPTSAPYGVVLSRTQDAARFVVVAEGDPLSGSGIRLVDGLRETMDERLARLGLGGATAGFAGDTALVAEIVDTAGDDLGRVIPVVLLAVALVLAVLLRALVAPLYLVVLAALAPLAAIGLAVALFQGVLDQQGLAYFVPLVSGVLLVALGSDYNIFLVGRIWAEARERPLTEAIVVGGAGASRAITAAGLILAGSFAALALTDVRAFVQLAFVLAAGLLIDAFLVRTLLTPAIIAIVGERSAWPGRGLRLARPETAPGR